MIYLIGKMLLPLFFSVMIGLWLGWQLRGLEFSQRLRTLQNEWAARFRSSDQERDFAIKKSTTLDLKSKQYKKQLEASGKLLKRYEEKRKQSQITTEEDNKLIKKLSSALNRLRINLVDRDEKLKKLSTFLIKLKELERSQKDKIRSGSNTIERLILQTKEKSNEIQVLHDELNIVQENQKSTHASSTDIKKDYFDLQAKLNDRETKLDLIKHELEAQKETATSMEKELQAIQAQVTTAPANDLDMQLTKSNRPVWILEEPNQRKDNLQMIKGVGPVMEKLLNEIGIFHYNQLARMNESDCLWVSDRIRTFPKRIKRDRWQQQAVELDLDQHDQEKTVFTKTPQAALNLEEEEE